MQETTEYPGTVGGNIADAGLSVNDKGGVKQTIGNVVKAIYYDENLKEMFQYNELSEKVEAHGAWWKRSSMNLSDNDVNNVRLYLEQNYGLSHEKHIPRAIDIIAHQRTYHPIRDYLNDLQWDGVKRIENLLPKYLGAEKSEYTTEALKLFMLGAINRVFSPGIKFDFMLCVADTNQGGGKSTIARFLAINDNWFTDDIKNLEDENIYRKLQGHWIIEFSEMLSVAKTKTIEGIKSFLSRQTDTYKIPYAVYAQDFPRQCVFFGTSNNTDFLPNDSSGNRRFIPVLVNSEMAEAHPLENEAETRAYIIQAWAEAMNIFRSGKYSLKFPKELQEKLSDMQLEFTPENPKVGIIQDWLDHCEYRSVCSLMIYKEALGNEYQKPQLYELKEINNIMKLSIHGWKRHGTKDSKVRITGYGKQRAWDRIVPEESDPNSFASMDDDGQQMKLPFE